METFLKDKIIMMEVITKQTGKVSEKLAISMILMDNKFQIYLQGKFLNMLLKNHQTNLMKHPKTLINQQPK